MKCQSQEQLIIGDYEEIYFLLQYIFFFCPVVLETAQRFVEVLRQNFIVQELSSLIWTILPLEIRNVKSSNLFKKKTRELTPAPNSYECYHLCSMFS